MMIESSSHCPKCQAPLSVDENEKEALCEACLLEIGLDGSSALIENTDPSSVFEGALSGADADVSFHAFDDYELVEELARGGMGVVLRGHQISLDRPVALKFIRSERLISKEARKRFQTEAAAAAGLDHPNIVPVYEAGEYEGHSYLSMKLIEGRTLADSSGVQQSSAAQLMAKITRAVYFAHGRGILHRDLKPSNILIDSSGEPFLTDFGLAKIANEDADLTQTTATMGTPRYMSPEQCRSDHASVSVASDVYSLGVILYEILAGRPPFEGDSTHEVMRQIIDDEPLRPSLHTGSGSRSATIRDLETICLKCLEKEPSRRYENAAALADDLERVKNGVPIHARRVGTIERCIKWARRKPALAATGTLAVLAMVLGTGVSLVQWQRAEAEKERGLVRLYAADMRIVALAVEEGNLKYAQDLLAAHGPGAGGEDRRGWEWYYLRSRLNETSIVLAHESSVDCLAISSNGSLLATGTSQGIVLWRIDGEDVSRQREIKLSGDTNGTINLAVSEDSRWLAALHSEETANSVVVCVYDLHDALNDAPSHQMPGYRVNNKIAFAGDTIVVSGGSIDSQSVNPVRYAVQLWRFKTESELRELAGATGCIAVANDGASLAAVTHAGEIGLWNTTAWTLIRTFSSENPTPHSALCFSSSGRKLAGLADGRVEIWHVDTGTLEHRWDTAVNNTRARLAIFAGEDKLITDSGFLASTWLIGPMNTSYEAEIALREHRAQITGLVAGGKEQRIASSSTDNTVRLWSPSAALNYDIAFEPARPLYAPQEQISPDGAYLAALSSMSGQVTIYNTNTAAVVTKVGAEPFALDVKLKRKSLDDIPASGTSQILISQISDSLHLRVFDETGDQMVDGYVSDLTNPGAQYLEEAVRIYEGKVSIAAELVESGATTSDLEISKRGKHVAREDVVHLATTMARSGQQPWVPTFFSVDGKSIFSPIFDRPAGIAGSPRYRHVPILGVHRWEFLVNPAKPAETIYFEGPPTRVSAGASSPDRTTMVLGHVDGRVDFWSLHDGSMIGQVERTGTKPILGIEHSPDGKSIAWLTPEGLWFYHLEERTLRRIENTEIQMRITKPRFSPDGTRIAMGANDNAIRIVAVAHPEQQTLLYGHRSFVKNLAWSTDGRTLASVEAGNDSLKLWNTATYREVAQLHASGRSFVQFIGNRLYTASGGWKIIAWEAPGFGE